MVELPLSRGMVALIDDSDFRLVGGRKWYAKTFENGTYAAHTEYGSSGRTGRTLLLHRVLMGAKAGEFVDHRNGDTLDNQRGNLRITTNAQNCQNQKLRSNNTSGYKGVTFHPNNKNWVAKIHANNKAIHVGVFQTSEEAALAYNEAALKYHGEFARLNEVLSDW